MTQESRDVVQWTLGTLLSLSVLVGLAVRFVLMPYLRDHLVDPLRQVTKQVTENHHKNDEPTLPDRIDDVSSEVGALARVLEGHLESSDRWLDAIVRRLDSLESAIHRHHPQ